MRPNLYGLDLPSLEAVVASLDARPFHAAQIFRWMYARDVRDPAGWTDLPRGLRERIAGAYRADGGTVSGRAVARDGTVKYRIETAGGGTVEAVYMTQSGRVTLCISSQVGCALACDFCLTGKMGLDRHLDAGEIAGQVALIRSDRELGAAPFNVVFMGMGEPLHNYDGVTAALRLLTAAEGFSLSRRRITVSTSGLAPAIERLASEPVRPRLAISLNATTDAVRDRLMPVNRRYPLARLLEAARRFREASGEPYTFEYVLLDGVNDTDADVERLAKILRAHGAKLNLIPFNPVPGWLEYRPPSRERILAVRDRLLARDLRVSVRWSRGAEARAACGQLALLPERPGAAAAHGGTLP